jgi:hypothetical protein
VQELVNQDDLGGRAIQQECISEVPSAHVNEPRPGLCERQRDAPAALRRVAVIGEPQRTEGVGWTFPGCHELGREALARCIRKVSEHTLAAPTGESGGGALNREPDGESRFVFRESEKIGRLRTGATRTYGGHQGAGKNAEAAQGFLFAGSPFRRPSDLGQGDARLG